MKRAILSISVCLCSLLVWSAMPSASQAQQLFENKQYSQAEEVYLQLIKRQPENPLYLYRYARCLQERGDFQEAIRYFERAGERYPLRNFYLGELYLNNYQFQEAVNAYQKYLAKTDTTNERYHFVIKQIELAEKGIRYLKRVDDIQIIDSVIVKKDEFLKAYNISKSAGTLGVSGGLAYYINEKKDRKITTNEHFQLVDCQQLLDGEWMCDVLNMATPTQMRCNFPYMLADGITLYFAAEEENGLGGYDIYITQYNTNSNAFLAPENIGMPYNSPANDYMLAIDDVKGVGYFASDRHTASDKVCIYTFIPNEEKRILRDTTDSYIRLFAQGLILQPKTQEEVKVNVVTDTTNNLETITMRPFVVNDTTVYLQLSDFRSIDARVLYEEYLKQEQQLNLLCKDIEDKREAYKDATPDEQRTLSEQLLEMENTYLRQKKELPELLKKVHQVERQ